MGTWGAGNFDNDSALDYLGEVVDNFEAKIEGCFADEEGSALDEGGEGVLMPSVAILSILCEHCKAPPPKPGTVARWKQQYLALFDEEIDNLQPAPNHKEERRKVIADTFNKLEMQSQKFWQDEETAG